MSGASAAVMATAAVASAAIAYNNGQQQKKAAEQAAADATARAAKNEKAMDEATNRTNQKGANAGAARDMAAQSGMAGLAGTMLTGGTGVDPSILQLGKSTLLGS